MFPRFYEGGVLTSDVLEELLDPDTGIVGELLDLHTDTVIYRYKTDSVLNMTTTYQALDTTNLRFTVPARTDGIYKWVMVNFFGSVSVVQNAEAQVDVWDLTSSVKLNGWTGADQSVNDVYAFSSVAGTYYFPFNVFHFVPYTGSSFQIEVRGNETTANASLFNYGLLAKFTS